MDMQTILVIAGAAGAAFLGSKLLIAGDTRVEDRRKRAVQLSNWCSKNGLPVLSSLLGNYATGDYSGAISGISQISDIVSDPVQAQGIVDQFLNVQLTSRLATAEGKESLITAIEKALNVKIDRSAVTQVPVEVKKEVVA